MSEISYSKKNDRIECVRYKDWRKSYPPHTLHEIKTVGDECYSMVVLCTALEPDEIVAEDCARDYESTVARLDELQKSILENPENIYLIEQMAHDACISPFHMIREFKKAFGLTPHQFQMQCKVRKAQKLLEERPAAEVTFDAGFYDQSHMDRCFKKVVGLSPKEYKRAVKTDT